jgi:uncharacterized membrane protein YphA (DoxX/SURF4 family)
MKYFVQLIRVLVGCLFIFSGAVKAIDPLGTSYKMHDYFSAFAATGWPAFWQTMNGYAVSISVIMIVLELIAGFALLIGWSNRFTVWLLFLMTLFFTVLTGFTYLSGFCPSVLFALYSVALVALIMITAWTWHASIGKKIGAFTGLALLVYIGLIFGTDTLLTCAFDKAKMKVTDCGCFGDFIKLQPYQTFWKDVVLDVLIFILVIGVRYIQPIFNVKTTYLLTLIFSACSLLFSFSNYLWGLPIVDFRPYKIGNNIRELRVAQKPAVTDFVFIYKNTKTQQEKEFKMDELSNVTDEYEFVDRREKVLDPGIPAKIDGFYINDANGDITDSLLNDKNFSLMVVAYHLGETDSEVFKKSIVPLADKVQKAGFSLYCVYGADVNAEPLRHQWQASFPFYTADETPLKTIIRSNPGLVLLKDGVVIDMWHKYDVPSFETLQQKYLSK